MKCVILAGGLGTRISEESHLRPRPMVDTEVLYLMSQLYRPEAARGLRWDDPALRIAWPIADPLLSDHDRGLPRLGA